MKKDNIVMVVYAFDSRALPLNAPWIYGVYSDTTEGFRIQKVMENSENFGHLTWMNNILKIDDK